MAINIPKPDHVLGLDLGRVQDFTALVALERSWELDPVQRDRLVSQFALRYLKRWPLGTRYTKIVDDVGELVERKPLDNPLLGIDQTGVGGPVVAMFQDAGMVATIRPVLITAGHEVTFGDDGSWHVPKKELVSALQVLLQARRLDIAPLPERALLVKELTTFKVKITVAANETFEAWRERDHDDMVLATAIAAYLGQNMSLPFVPPTPIDVPRRRLEPETPQPERVYKPGENKEPVFRSHKEIDCSGEWGPVPDEDDYFRRRRRRPFHDPHDSFSPW
jgi:hypothetical protein